MTEYVTRILPCNRQWRHQEFSFGAVAQGILGMEVTDWGQGVRRFSS